MTEIKTENKICRAYYGTYFKDFVRSYIVFDLRHPSFIKPRGLARIIKLKIEINLMYMSSMLTISFNINRL